MTREVAEKIVRGITDKIECNTADMDDWAEFWGFTVDEYEEFLDMAIKALEQQPFINKPYVSEGVCREDKIQVLDKIRAEINTPNRGTCDYFIVDRIEEIINEYKTESEDKE